MPEPGKSPPRRTGWTRAKMAAFLRALAASRSVSEAARSVGMSRQSAYKLRNRLAGMPFDLAWATIDGWTRAANPRRRRAPAALSPSWP
jgi:molybdenum-dependent DNA-binding transcriptional regulator ModE